MYIIIRRNVFYDEPKEDWWLPYGEDAVIYKTLEEALKAYEDFRDKWSEDMEHKICKLEEL